MGGTSSGGKDAGTINKDMLDILSVHAESRAKKRRRTPEGILASPEVSEARYEVDSHLLKLQHQKKRKANLGSVAPFFWALLRAPTTSSTTNMKLDVMNVQVPTCLAPDTTRPTGFKFASSYTITVKVPYAVNTRALKEDDVLVLPMA